ncbi:MAG: serine/threonine-protein kinase [Cyanobacteria bacterium P01_G01_bin.54]
MHNLHSSGALVGDRYTVQGKLGQGAVGTTYAAVDIHTQQAVALKAVSLSETQDWKVLEMFEREAQTLAQLSHPCIPQYLGCFYIDTPRDRYFYLVQERILGHSLETLIRQRGWRPDEAEVQAIALQVLEILAYLHSHDPPVIHRDIKPHNLIRTEDSEIVLVDFGAVQEAFRHTLSRGGTFIGTIDYMPPEQFRGEATFASDLYSLGVTLLDLLTGPNTIAELPAKRLKLDFREAVNISTMFANWLDRLIEPTAEDRFQSSQAAKQVLLKPRKLAQKRKRIKPDLLPLYELESKPESDAQLLIVSRIQLCKNEKYIEVVIPPVMSADFKSLACLFLGVFTSMVGLFTWIKILPSVSSISLLILFAAFAYIMVNFCLFVMSIFGYFSLLINAEYCRLYWRCFCFNDTIYRSRKKLIKAGIDQHSIILLFSGNYNPLILGAWLKKNERDFTVAEVNRFLYQLKVQSRRDRRYLR